MLNTFYFNCLQSQYPDNSLYENRKLIENMGISIDEHFFKKYRTIVFYFTNKYLDDIINIIKNIVLYNYNDINFHSLNIIVIIPNDIHVSKNINVFTNDIIDDYIQYNIIKSNFHKEYFKYMITNKNIDMLCYENEVITNEMQYNIINKDIKYLHIVTIPYFLKENRKVLEYIVKSSKYNRIVGGDIKSSYIKKEIVMFKKIE